MNRPLLLPLVPLYRAGLWLSRRRSTPQTLQHPVLSVGSISAGGAGKTPFVAALADLVQTYGYTASILSRGYGRISTATVRVDPASTAAHFGDEPLLLARTLGIPVYVGNSRHAAGLLAEQQIPPHARHLHLLDDGFSHHALHRSADIVLLTADDIRDTLLPAGNLREPISALRRAHILVLRTSEADELRPILAHLGLTSKPTWRIDRTVSLPPDLPANPVVFSALARPTDFDRDLHHLGLTPAATRHFPDHHRYTHRDITDLCALATSTYANGFVTTAKDAVKLTPGMLRHLAATAPLTTAALTVTLQDPTAAIADLRNLLPPPGRV